MSMTNLNLKNLSDDPVNHPSHYTDGKIEVIDFIEDKKLGFHLGNAVKYISRAGKKDLNKEIEDLQKAVWYIERYILLKSIKTLTMPTDDIHITSDVIQGEINANK